MTNKKRTKGQTMICNNYTENKTSSNTNPTKNDNIRFVMYLRSLIMYVKWQYAISDLFTITDNVR
jgi:hypothetical protein